MSLNLELNQTEDFYANSQLNRFKSTDSDNNENESNEKMNTSHFFSNLDSDHIEISPNHMRKNHEHDNEELSTNNATASTPKEAAETAGTNNTANPATVGSATTGSATTGSATTGSATTGSATTGSATTGSATTGSATAGTTNTAAGSGAENKDSNAAKAEDSPKEDTTSPEAIKKYITEIVGGDLKNEANVKIAIDAMKENKSKMDKVKEKVVTYNIIFEKIKAVQEPLMPKDAGGIGAFGPMTKLLLAGAIAKDFYSNYTNAAEAEKNNQSAARFKLRKSKINLNGYKNNVL